MLKKTKIFLTIHAIVLGSTGLASTLSSAVYAKDKIEATEEVVVIGSAIKRKDLDGALPLQVFTKEQLDRTGVVTTADLMDTMPAMQGFTTAGDSVGGGGGGIRTVSIHDIGEEYSLVLLNGHRMAPADSGGTIDITAIPMSMLKKVDVLTDGASALYGSDAIAGVVNFQLKDEVKETTVSTRYAVPIEGAGETFDVDIITGFGTLADDGFALVAGFNHHDQKQLAAADRDFAKSGIFTVKHPETDQLGLFFNASGNAIPGNATAIYIDIALVDDPATEDDERISGIVFNPYLKANGSCAKNNAQIDESCYFDYTSTIEIVPESTGDTLFLNGHYKVSDDLTAFSTLVYSKNSLTSRVAPYPTGNVPIPLNSSLVATYVTPYLTADQAANLLEVSGTWRALPAGNRTTEFLSDALHFVAGFDGSVSDINYSGAFTFAKNAQEQNYTNGWLLLDPFVNLVSSGGIDIFTTPDNISSDEKAALAQTVYRGPWDATKVMVKALEGLASKPIFTLGGGDAVIAAGVDYRHTTYDRSISDANANELLLFLSKDTPYDMSRSQWGIYSELLMPLTDTLEVTTSARYDSISAVDSQGFGSVGETMDDSTYKISARWTLIDMLAIRGSFGTGFKAPSMLEVAEPLTEFGVTSDSYSCPFVSPDPLAAYCLPGESQAAVYREGYAKLKPESSTQATMGFVLTPTSETSLIIDYWKVAIADKVERLNEGDIFGAPTVYRDLFTYKTNLATDEKELAIIQRAVNSGKYDASGIDYNLSLAVDLGMGLLTTTLSGTYMIKSESPLNGSSLGHFGGENKVTFRNQIRLGVALDQGMFNHSLSLNFKSGYLDQAQTVNLIDANGVVDYLTNTDIQLTVPSYYFINYQTKVKLMEDKVELTLGINNLLDKEPPLSLRTSGAGHQVGWDPRYVDAYGRTLYLRAQYSF